MKKIYIFDFDDTLWKTSAKVKYKHQHTDNHYFTLEEYVKHTKDHGKKSLLLDYSEFYDLRILNAGIPVEPWFSKFIRLLKENKPVAIITARARKNSLIKFFDENLIPINPSMVYAVNDVNENYIGDVPERKLQAFKKIVDMGYQVTEYHDDMLDNIKHLERFAYENNINFKYFHVNEKS